MLLLLSAVATSLYSAAASAPCSCPLCSHVCVFTRVRVHTCAFVPPLFSRRETPPWFAHAIAGAPFAHTHVPRRPNPRTLTHTPHHPPLVRAAFPFAPCLMPPPAVHTAFPFLFTNVPLTLASLGARRSLRNERAGRPSLQQPLPLVPAHNSRPTRAPLQAAP